MIKIRKCADTITTWAELRDAVHAGSSQLNIGDEIDIGPSPHGEGGLKSVLVGIPACGRPRVLLHCDRRRQQRQQRRQPQPRCLLRLRHLI